MSNVSHAHSLRPLHLFLSVVGPVHNNRSSRVFASGRVLSCSSSVPVSLRMSGSMEFRLTGIIPATFTPMHSNGDINLEAIDGYVDVLAKQGIESIFVLGTTGEGCSLSNEEREQVAEEWVKAGKARMKNIIVHVGACNLVDTQTLARHSESIGASAIATMPSIFFKPATPKHLALYLAEVAKAAPKTPLLLYHIPSMSGITFPIKKVLDEIEEIGIPNFVGVKYTAIDLCDLGQCIDHYGHKYSIIFGKDEQLCSGLFLGAESAVGSTYNYATKIFRKIYEACRSGDTKTAKEEQFKAQRFITYLISAGLDNGLGKALMLPVAGLDLGPPRLPVLPPSKEKMDEVVKHLREMGFFEWIK